MCDVVWNVDVDDTEALAHGPVDVLHNTIALDTISKSLAFRLELQIIPSNIQSMHCEDLRYYPADQAVPIVRAYCLSVSSSSVAVANNNEKEKTPPPPRKKKKKKKNLTDRE